MPEPEAETSLTRFQGTVLASVFAMALAGYGLALNGLWQHAGPGAAGLTQSGAQPGRAIIADYDIRAIRTGRAEVPRLFLTRIPGDYFAIGTIPERKREFIRILLPLVLAANEEIRIEREQLLAVLRQRSAGTDLTLATREWLAALMAKYEVGAGDFGALLRRVDSVSPAVALSQAIEETGWGRSRFVKQGNALFGQRTWTGGAGLVPISRSAGQRFEVKRFDSMMESVRDYAHNLNTHPAYAEYRVLRATLRASGRHAPLQLARTLNAWSERGPAYTATIADIIGDNRLEQFETARLTAIGPATQPAERLSLNF